VAAGAVAGALFGWLLAFLALRYGRQIIVGVVIVAFCTGLTNFLTEQVLSPDQNLNAGLGFSSFGSRCWTRSLSWTGAVQPERLLLRSHHLARGDAHRAVQNALGLRSRAVASTKGAETVGIHVLSVRYRNVILGADRRYRRRVVHRRQRRGVFGRHDRGARLCGTSHNDFDGAPVRALSAALLSLLDGSAELPGSVEREHPGTVPFDGPYLITIAVVAGLVGRVRPSADGVPTAASRRSGAAVSSRSARQARDHPGSGGEASPYRLRGPVATERRRERPREGVAGAGRIGHLASSAEQ